MKSDGVLDSIAAQFLGAEEARRKKIKRALDEAGILLNKPIGEDSLNVAILGGGSFGTAIAHMAAKNGCRAVLWVRDRRAVRHMKDKRINKKYLPTHRLHHTLEFSHDLREAVMGKDIIFVAVPSSGFRETLQKISPYISAQAVVSLTKGIEKRDDDFYLMSDVITQELPEVNFAVMSGPNLALELINNMPSAAVVASPSETLKDAVHMALSSAFFGVYKSDDVRGVELGGALKNIYAVCMGMVAASQIGENTKAMILTRALAEMSAFGRRMGADPMTFLGLSGVGDLYATCNSTLSRNYRIGELLGRGASLESAIRRLGQTAEGINTIYQVYAHAKKIGIELPVAFAMYGIIYEKQSPLKAAFELMSAVGRHEFDME